MLIILPHLGLHLPTRNGCFAVIPGFELQVDGAWANVGDGHAGGGAGQLCEEAERHKESHIRVQLSWLIYLQQLPLVAEQILHTDSSLPPVLLYSWLRHRQHKSRLDLEKRCVHKVHGRRQCHECQLHGSYLEIWFNLISYCLHSSWVNNKNGLFLGKPWGETNLKMANSRNSRRVFFTIWISLFVCVLRDFFPPSVWVGMYEDVFKIIHSLSFPLVTHIKPSVACSSHKCKDMNVTLQRAGPRPGVKNI